MVLQVEFDVVLVFNGELGTVVKRVRSTASLEVTFGPADFEGHFGKMVRH